MAPNWKLPAKHSGNRLIIVSCVRVTSYRLTMETWKWQALKLHRNTKQLLDIILSLCVEHLLWSQHAICLYLEILRERTRGFKPCIDEKRDTRLPSNFPKFTHLVEPELRRKLSDNKSPDKRQRCCVCRGVCLRGRAGGWAEQWRSLTFALFWVQRQVQ